MTTSSAPWKGLDWVLGLSVRLKTVAGEEPHNTPLTLALNQHTQCPRKPPTSAHHPKHDFRIFKINFIKEISVVPSSPPPQVPAPAQPASNGGDAETPNAGPFATTVPVVGFVQVERLQAREAQTLKEATQQLARIGVGVTTEGQDIFDALSKT
ncbi:hypothetical protein BC936DRAFT_148294 [Jimgerdemannia flammicorona]|uniref:AD domain-containing protein n=1 Tax=Jimgerdemannia flammicorona TaxID=994334 RepID=A0A433D3E3_9FUNG|nr:hypothetical protein BC936DRAFT_148294 [Jimgerdemannia flammicorona]